MPAWGLIPDSPIITGGSKYLHGISKGIRSSSRTANKSPINMTLALGKVKIYEPILYRELNLPGGVTWRYMEKLGGRIVRGARVQAGYRTGALKKSIHMSHAAGAGGQYLWIGSNLHYAYMHHEGTRPHIILPKEAGGALVFTRGARMIRTAVVHHPGTKPNRYLSDQLRIHIPR